MRKSPGASLLIVFAATLFLSWFVRALALGSESPLFAGMMLALSGCLLLMALFHVLDREPQVIIDGNGVWLGELHPWESIAGVSHYDESLNLDHVVRLKLKDGRTVAIVVVTSLYSLSLTTEELKDAIHNRLSRSQDDRT